MKTKPHEALLLLSPPAAFCHVNQEPICVFKGYTIIIVEPIWGGLLALKPVLAPADGLSVDTELKLSYPHSVPTTGEDAREVCSAGSLLSLQCQDAAYHTAGGREASPNMY